MKRIVILGSTGSIGCSTLDVVAKHPDRLQLVGIAAHSNVKQLAAQVHSFKPQVVALANTSKVNELKSAVSIPVLQGDEGMIEMVTRPDVDVVMIATSGSSALIPLVHAIKAGKQVALASKELLVMAGALIMRLVHEKGTHFMPVDSEHAALAQCLQGVSAEQVKCLTVTGSGGPLWKLSKEEMAHVTQEQVLNHPKWSMGPKITVDSATLMNKGLEFIEAHWLFGMPLENIRVVIHPQAAVHALVEMVDGSLMAQMSACDMRLPIQYALSYPERWNGIDLQFDVTQLSGMHFYEPDIERFPCLPLAMEAARQGESACIALNGANDVAVEAYLKKRIHFLDIPKVIENTLSQSTPVVEPTLEDVLQIDQWARATANEVISQCSEPLSTL